MTVTVLHGDCIERMRSLPDNSVDAVCTDPPYGLEFMGKQWDSFKPPNARIRLASERDLERGVEQDGLTARRRNKPESYIAGLSFQQWCEEWARECYRVLKPGGHLLAFGGTRTYHRLACGVEDAGFEVRDSIHWLYGSGFPKSHNVGKAIDDAAGVDREVIGVNPTPTSNVRRSTMGRPETSGSGFQDVHLLTAPATNEAKEWEGWGTALKPSHEPIIVARKPLSGTVAQNVLEHGTGAINIDACRVEAMASDDGAAHSRKTGATDTVGNFGFHRDDAHAHNTPGSAGRWPSNILLSHSSDCQSIGVKTIKGDNRSGRQGKRPSGFVDIGADRGDEKPNGPLYGNTEVEAWECSEDCPVAELDRQSGNSKSQGGSRGGKRHLSFGMSGQEDVKPGFGDGGGASRYFPTFRYQAKSSTRERTLPDGSRSTHPTVKPIELMRWLLRLVTPPDGTVLDPFLGSGTTAVACILEGFSCIGIDQSDEYCAIARQRIDEAQQQKDKAITQPALFA